MKKILYFLIVLMAIPITFADISMKTDQPIYNLGDKVSASASVLSSSNFEGLFKLTISCGNYNLPYFITPVNLEANFRTAITVPELAATSAMMGNCTLIGGLTTNDNSVVEEKESMGPEVTDQLNILPIQGKITSLPADTVLAAGVVNEAYGNNVLKASVKIKLDSESYSAEAVDGKFTLNVPLANNIKSGKHTIEITATDSKNNHGYGTIELEITAIPSYIRLELSASQTEPGSKVQISASLLDQANELINTSLGLQLASPKNDKVFDKSVQSSEGLAYEFSQYSQPGTYSITSTFKQLVSQASINISTVRQVKINYRNESVLVENTGNVPFQDELTFMLQNELNKYPIVKKISIDPGKFLSIDLSKEVPLGIYNVISPLKENINSAKESLEGQYQNFLANNVTIHDNRPIYKKIATSLTSMGGLLVGADGLLTKNPLVAPIILMAILALVVIRYGRKPIMKMIKGKKDSEGKEKEH